MHHRRLVKADMVTTDHNRYLCELIQYQQVTRFAFLSSIMNSAVQLDSEVDEVFLNVTPLHRAESYIQKELNKLQTSVRLGVCLTHTFKATGICTV